MEKLYIVTKKKKKKKDQEMTVAQFRFKLEKAGKTTRPFSYDLNRFSYNYTVEVTNIFKGLDLPDRVPEELWMEVCDIVQETVVQMTRKGKKNTKTQNGCLRKPYK